MKTIGNVLWFIFTGLFTALGYFFLGILWCITIVGIPFGLQSFKFAKLSMFPFGKEITKEKGHPIVNFIWFILGGFGLWIGFILGGLIWCVTIIGIPFGKQCFKLAKLSRAPFGRVVAAPAK